MSTRRRSWWYGITPQGLIIALTSAATTLTITVTACYLLLNGRVEQGLQVLGYAGFSGLGTSSLAARLRQDPAVVELPPGPVD